MRHRKRRRQLGRTGSERQAMLRNLVTSLFVHQRIETTVAKAKEARRLAEKLITLGKEPTLHHRRQAYSFLQNRDMVRLLFEQIAPLFKNRAGGYTRIIRSRNRLGDGAEMSILELTEFRPGKIAKTRAEKTKEKIKEKRRSRAAETEAEQFKKEPTAAGKPPVVEKPEVEKPLPSEKAKPEVPPEARKPEQEEKKAPEKKGFLQGIRKIFGRKKDR